ncbi:nitrogenase-stabilizing/protective protein NifW [Acerihabitans arboris]|uniref:Nitrogenase-stabilizing/protective protein NifW n=1 Tax=Acerihabitans arboris TaxID=2691583 RepID=A0A845SIV2_9GAMM|nr:nitrogenase-stabilizing/protective protein NifW [Acerihabitans arboris]NDL62956.1 nitrogen fixation protein NifW [Acerihabitans arboris]
MEWFSTLPGVDELESAEAFFNYFELPCDPAVIRTKRLHIMHDFHQRLAGVISLPLADLPPGEAGELRRIKAHWSLARRLLSESYRRFLAGEVAEQSGLSIYRRNQRCFTPWSGLMEVHH